MQGPAARRAVLSTNSGAVESTGRALPEEQRQGKDDSMSTDSKPADKQAAPVRSIPVKLLKFKQPIDVPGRNQAGNVTNRDGKYTIEYVPNMRHHMISYKAPGQPAVIGYVHESNVGSWEPA